MIPRVRTHLRDEWAATYRRFLEESHTPHGGWPDRPRNRPRHGVGLDLMKPIWGTDGRIVSAARLRWWFMGRGIREQIDAERPYLASHRDPLRHVEPPGTR